MKDEHKTVDEFFNSLPSEDKKGQDIFEDGKSTNAEKKPEPEKEKEIEPEEVPDEIKNRRHRRLEEKLQAERESNIALAERVKILSEQDKFTKETSIDPRIGKLFDTSTDLGKENAQRLADLLSDYSTKAKEEALREIADKQLEEKEEQKSYENFIDKGLESLEDRYNIDLTSDAPQARKARREFLEMVEKLSPKDDEGSITGYADFDSTYEIYKEKHTEKIDNSRQKEIASRSMQKSNSSSGSESQKKISPGWDGWKRDYGLE